MSIEFDAVLVVGVRYDEVVTTRTDVKDVTKYDPDTGEPYKRTVSTEVSLVCGVPKGDPDAYLENDLKLEIVVPGYNGDKDDAIVGVTIATVAQDVPYEQVAFTRLAAARDAVDRTLRAHGYTGPEPKPYVLLCAG